MREAKEVNLKAALTSQRVSPHQPLGGLQAQAMEADVQALAELSRALDKKVGVKILLLNLSSAVEIRPIERRESCHFVEQKCTTLQLVVRLFRAVF